MELKSYKDAMSHLINHGDLRYTKQSRAKIAKALVDLRNVFGRDEARTQRQNFLFICGRMPVKEK